MAGDDLKSQHSMNSSLDHEQSEQEWAALNAQLEESPRAAAQVDLLRKTDELLRTTPAIAPAPGFARRVMAAIAAMPLPEFAQRHLGVGIALGLVIAALFTIPIFSVVFLLVWSVLANPGALNSLLQAIINAASYLIGLVADIAGEIETAAEDTPMLVALLTTMVPVTILWGWLIWNLLGGPRLLRRSKS